MTPLVYQGMLLTVYGMSFQQSAGVRTVCLGVERSVTCVDMHARGLGKGSVGAVS